LFLQIYLLIMLPLTDEQWLLVRPLVEAATSRHQTFQRDETLKLVESASKVTPLTARHPGRPALDPRCILDGILWKLVYRKPWRTLPARFGSHQACYLYYRQWLLSGLLRQVILALLTDVQDRGGFDMQAAFKSHQVRFLPVDDRLQVYVLFSLAPSWQFHTAMLFYQLLASRLDQQLPNASDSPDPLECIFDDLHQ
jgi:transposase